MKKLVHLLFGILMTTTVVKANAQKTAIEHISSYDRHDVISILFNVHSRISYPTFGEVKLVYNDNGTVVKYPVSSLQIKESDFKSHKNSVYKSLTLAHDVSIETLLKATKGFKKTYGYDPSSERVKIMISFRNAFPENDQPFMAHSFTLSELFERVQSSHKLYELVRAGANENSKTKYFSEMHLKYIWSSN